jgi:hypothetical protein
MLALPKAIIAFQVAIPEEGFQEAEATGLNRSDLQLRSRRSDGS